MTTESRQLYEEVLGAAKAVIASRDEKTFGPERFVEDAAHGSYWSPHSSMVDSEVIARLRAAIAKLEAALPLQPVADKAHAITVKHGNFRFAEGHCRTRGENVEANLNGEYAQKALHDLLALFFAAGVPDASPVPLRRQDMRAEFNAWAEERGCDTDGAWSAWQGCWNLRQWRHVDSDGMPPCDGETVYVGINSAGFACCFNEVTWDGACSMVGPELTTIQMSGLRWWRALDRPTEEKGTPHA